MKRSYIIVLIAALLPSCMKEQPYVQPQRPLFEKGDVPIMVEPSLPEGWETLTTKAASDIQNITTAEKLQEGGIGVYAYYTGAQEFSTIDRNAYATTVMGQPFNPFGVVLYNRQFAYNDGLSKWENSGVDEFWPMTEGENLSLFSYAPYNVWSSHMETDSAQYGVPFVEVSTDNYIAENLSTSELENQKDLLWGTNTSGLPHKNVSKSQDHYSSGLVDMHFRHALAKVGFQVMGSLASENISFDVTSSSSTKQGQTETTNSAETIADGEPSIGNVTRGNVQQASSSNYDERVSAGWWNYNYYWNDEGGNRWTYRRPFTATKTFTQHKTYTQTQTEVYLEVESGGINRQGTRYMIEDVSFKGFNKKGVLLLDNTVAYEPNWTATAPFTGDSPEYVVNSSNVLTPSLRTATESAIASNPGAYPGIQTTPTDLMNGYFIYAIPRTATATDRIKVVLRYRPATIDGTSTGSRSRLVVKSRSRVITSSRTYQETKTVYEYQNSNSGWSTANSFDKSNFNFSSSHEFTSEAWGTESPGAWTAWTNVSESEWTLDPNESSPSYTVSYGDPVTLNGSLISSLLGGYEYTIRLIIADNTLDLIVAPNPWNLTTTDFDYSANENEPIQKLDYDSSTIDYVEGGDVYINNRVAKFSFLLGAGRYNAWQARFVGSPGAFGFTDENGEFIRNAGGGIATSIRGDIDPERINYIYIKATQIPAPVTSRSTLRIYYIDPSGKATVALNLVQDYNEWTIVQNAN